MTELQDANQQKIAHLQAENAELRSHNQWLRESIARLQKQMAELQAERWTPSILDKP